MDTIFDDLIIFEMANSHQGSVEHGLAIIREMGEIARKYQIKAAVKLQYRALDSFIHPDFKGRKDVPHVPRFESTRLQADEFATLVKAIREEGMLTMSTPFDEVSVKLCLDHNLDIIKIASCSATDWPLLEEIARSGKPIIVSTGGLLIEQMDNLYNFFTHRQCEFAMLHCVALYPAPADGLQLDLLDKMRVRYRGITIGYSGHENPNDTIIPSMAIAKGAKILERHVGLPTGTITLNAYSMNPEQADAWVRTIVAARQACTFTGERQIAPSETASLHSLMRGVYAKRAIQKGEVLTEADIFFAMPVQEGQMTSGEFRNGHLAMTDYVANAPIAAQQEAPSKVKLLRKGLHEAKAMLNEANIPIVEELQIELSHHYGPERFFETGCTLVNVMNREYCKKIIIVLPGQCNPMHYHLKKEESFQVLHGTRDLVLNGEKLSLAPGKIITVKRGDKHAFSSKTGAIFEEVSTTHYRNDSFYEDPVIANTDVLDRKSFLKDW
jgi:N-acetylneuraminate synthase